MFRFKKGSLQGSNKIALGNARGKKVHLPPACKAGTECAITVSALQADGLFTNQEPGALLRAKKCEAYSLSNLKTRSKTSHVFKTCEVYWI